MMIEKTIKIILPTAVGCLMLGACADEITSGTESAQTAVNIDLHIPELPDGAEVLEQFYTFKNVSTGESEEFSARQEIMLMPGLYDVEYTARVFVRDAAETTLRANRQSVNISGETFTLSLEAYNNIESDDLIIAEVFYTGTLQPSGNSYTGDDYIKLYNNSDHVIYADGLTIFESKFLTTAKYEYSPDIISEAMTVQALYTIPGSGKEVAVNPGEYLLICDTGIDHRQANPNSFDLTGAAFEWYDVSSNPKVMDIDGPVDNLDKWYCYTQSYWMLHNRGFKAYGIARIPLDRDTYLRDYWYDYDYVQETVVGSFPMSQSAYKLPNEWISDVVMCSVPSAYAWQVCVPSLDSGWTSCGEIDNDKNRYFRSVRRKLLYIAPDGRAVLQDTNNSTADFNRDCVPSEVELQHSATDAAGTPATVVTYDGVTPIE